MSNEGGVVSVPVEAETEVEEVDSVPIREVHIDGLAVLKIVKHCDTNAPNLVGGSLLGIDDDGILEITYSFPFPAPKPSGELGEKDEGEAEIDGVYYQTEMMTMLRDVNVDNNCVGWYQSMYLGTVYTNDVVDIQFKYQSTEDISENCVVIMYDHVQSKQGNLVLKAYRLTEEFVQQKNNKKNAFLKPSDMLEEIPVKIKNIGHVAAFARCLEDSNAEVDCTLEPLSMEDSDTVTERHLRECTSWLEDFVQEQREFQGYAKTISKPRMEQVKWLAARTRDNEERKKEGDDPLPVDLKDSGLKPLPDAPPMTEPALMIGQLHSFTDQLNNHVSTCFRKLYTAQQFNLTED